MALITCPECGKKISEYAEVCIGCGFPLKMLNQVEAGLVNTGSTQQVHTGNGTEYSSIDKPISPSIVKGDPEDYKVSSDYDKRLVIEKYLKAAPDQHIPELIIPNRFGRSKKTVTKISYNAFEGFTGLEKVVIPEGIEIIERDAFNGCSALRTVVFPASLKEIRMGAFQGCKSLTDVFFSGGVEEIGSCAFANCSALTHIILPEGLKTIHSGAFYNCTSLSKIELPESLESIEVSPQRDYSMHFGKDYGEWSYMFNWSWERSPTVDLNEIGPLAGAFENCPIESIILPAGLQRMGVKTFCNCRNLKYICIPENVEAIPKECFRGCISLQDVRLPAVLDSIHTDAFRGAGLKEIQIPAGCEVCQYYGGKGRYDPFQTERGETNRGLTIICKEDSSAQEFAEDYGYRTRVIEA